MTDLSKTPAPEPDPGQGGPAASKPSPSSSDHGAAPSESSPDHGAPPHRRRRVPLFLGALLLVLAIAAVAVSQWGHDPDPPAPTSPAAAAAAPTGKAAEGGPVGGLEYTTELLRGVKNERLTIGDAPITIVEFIDLQCPFCAQHQLQVQPGAVGDLVRTGRARITLLPLAFLGPDSARARDAFLKMGEKNLAWQFADLMFRNQGTENTGYVTQAYIDRLVAAIPGAKPGDASGPLDERSQEAKALADRLAKRGLVQGTPAFAVGLTGTPLTKFVGVGADFGAVLQAVAAYEAALAGKGSPPSSTPPQTPGTPGTPAPGGTSPGIRTA